MNETSIFLATLGMPLQLPSLGGTFDWSMFLNFVFGPTSIVSVYIAWNSRKAVIKQTTADAMKSMQAVYDTFTQQTRHEIDRLNSEHKALREQVEKCAHCPYKKDAK